MLNKKLRLVVALIASIICATTSVAATSTAPADQAGLAKDLIYFVFPDRYLNGDTSNDKYPGYDPRDTAFFHGGDLKGLTGTCAAGDNGLARIKKLGFTSIWVTPPVKQQALQGNSAAYHGYWGLDFTTVDPHLGSEYDFKEFVVKAHAIGLKVIIDIVEP